jgi:putative nucleotidyltransferase with HDIG domain
MLYDQEQEIFLNRLSDEIEYRNPFAHGHAQRVANLAALTAIELNVDEKQLQAIRVAARWHDIGKVAIPDALLLKPGKLRESERHLLQEHVHIGGELLRRLGVPATIVRAVAEHHERANGTGYPKGRDASSTSIGAQVIGLVEAFDAMTVDQPFRAARTPEFALSELHYLAREGVFDPRLVTALGEVLRNSGILTRPASSRQTVDGADVDLVDHEGDTGTVVDLHGWRDKGNNGEE